MNAHTDGDFQVGLLVLLCFGLFFLIFAAEAIAAEVSGSWDLKVETAQGTATPSITIQQDGEKITGIYHGRIGDSKLEGRLTGDKIQFSVTLKFQDRQVVVKYSGTIEEDRMKGEVQFGDAPSSPWSARRQRNR